MSKLLFTIRWVENNPSVEQVAERLKIRAEDIDSDFGVVPIDPERFLYSILVEEKGIGGTNDEILGPFANPRIGPFD